MNDGAIYSNLVAENCHKLPAYKTHNIFMQAWVAFIGIAVYIIDYTAIETSYTCPLRTSFCAQTIKLASSEVWSV